MAPTEMNAVMVDRFGGPEVLRHDRRTVPDVGPHDVLIEVAYAGVGSWDPLQREGVFVEITGERPEFPFVPGGDGSGTVVAVGSDVDEVREGDAVYAMGAGFYAEYVAVDADAVSRIPEGLDLAQGGAMPVVALTALHGLVEELRVAPGETVLVTGASGDTGHIALQLAKLLGARVLAVASGSDGAQAARELGADVAVDGRADDIVMAARAFAPEGVDAVLALVGGPSLDAAITVVRDGGRVAHPLGVLPEPTARDGVEVRQFDLTLTTPEALRALISRLGETIAAGPFSVRVAGIYPLEEAAEAQRALEAHRVGKILLTTSSSP